MANWRIRKKIKISKCAKKKKNAPRFDSFWSLLVDNLFHRKISEETSSGEFIVDILDFISYGPAKHLLDQDKRLNRADMELWNSPGALGILCIALSGIVQKPYIRYSSLEAKGTDQNSQTCLGDALGVVDIKKAP